MAGAGTMDDRRQPGGATIVATAGGGRRAARGGKSSAGTSYLYLLLTPCGALMQRHPHQTRTDQVHEIQYTQGSRSYF